jgi:glycosyltransferase involved in cell wall biosynthesis
MLEQAREVPLPPELAEVRGPVVLFFGLLRPYKGIEVLLESWRGLADAELWIVGRPRVALEPLRAKAPKSVRFVPRFISDAELPAYFRRADVVVLPYLRTERLDFSGVLATALGFGRAVVASDIGGFHEVAATGGVRLVAPGDPGPLREALAELVGNPASRRRLEAGARAAADGPYSWDRAAVATLELYRRLLAT